MIEFIRWLANKLGIPPPPKKNMLNGVTAVYRAASSTGWRYWKVDWYLFCSSAVLNLHVTSVKQWTTHAKSKPAQMRPNRQIKRTANKPKKGYSKTTTPAKRYLQYGLHAVWSNQSAWRYLYLFLPSPLILFYSLRRWFWSRFTHFSHANSSLLLQMFYITAIMIRALFLSTTSDTLSSSERIY